MKKKARRKVLRNLHKNLTQKQLNKLAYAYVNKSINFQSCDKCPLGIMFKFSIYNKAQAAIEHDLNVSTLSCSAIESFWSYNPVKGYKDVKYLLTL